MLVQGNTVHVSHKRHWTAGDPVEGGGGADQHLHLRKPIDTRRPPRVQDRKMDRDGYNGVKAHPGAFQNRLGPHLPGITGP